ncbi:MAG: hypothetical protein WDO24_01030 [Pseudomonadota bacterium]
MKPDLFRLSLKNVHAEWRMDPAFVKQVGAFGQQMLENKLIRTPVTEGLVVTTFTDELVKSGL